MGGTTELCPNCGGNKYTCKTCNGEGWIHIDKGVKNGEKEREDIS